MYVQKSRKKPQRGQPFRHNGSLIRTLQMLLQMEKVEAQKLAEKGQREVPAVAEEE